jgi:hypothetical protein
MFKQGDMDYLFSPFRTIPAQPVEKRTIFVSYHRDGDEDYYDYFADVFANSYRIIRGNSLREEIWSDNLLIGFSLPCAKPRFVTSTISLFPTIEQINRGRTHSPPV